MVPGARRAELVRDGRGVLCLERRQESDAVNYGDRLAGQRIHCRESEEERAMNTNRRQVLKVLGATPALAAASHQESSPEHVHPAPPKTTAQPTGAAYKPKCF